MGSTDLIKPLGNIPSKREELGYSVTMKGRLRTSGNGRHTAQAPHCPRKEHVNGGPEGDRRDISGGSAPLWTVAMVRHELQAPELGRWTCPNYCS